MMTFVSNQFFVDIENETLLVGLGLDQKDYIKLCTIDLKQAEIAMHEDYQHYLKLPVDGIGRVFWCVFHSLFIQSSNDQSDFLQKLKLYFLYVMRTLKRDHFCEDAVEELEEMIDYIHLTLVLFEEKSSVELLNKYMNRAN